jgi:HPt (histidine-containing phosphotransfer) domain-containing protein
MCFFGIQSDILIKLENDLDGDFEIVREVIEIYIETSPTYIEKMNQSLLENHYHEMAKAAHSLKSSSSYLGAMHLGKMCAQMEKLHQSGISQSEKYTELFHKIELEWAYVIKQLSSYKDKK